MQSHIKPLSRLAYVSIAIGISLGAVILGKSTPANQHYSLNNPTLLESSQKNAHLVVKTRTKLVANNKVNLNHSKDTIEMIGLQTDKKVTQTMPVINQQNPIFKQTLII
jgi:hypothetical protein